MATGMSVGMAEHSITIGVEGARRFKLKDVTFFSPCRLGEKHVKSGHGPHTITSQE